MTVWPGRTRESPREVCSAVHRCTSPNLPTPRWIADKAQKSAARYFVFFPRSSGAVRSGADSTVPVPDKDPLLPLRCTALLTRAAALLLGVSPPPGRPVPTFITGQRSCRATVFADTGRGSEAAASSHYRRLVRATQLKTGGRSIISLR